MIIDVHTHLGDILNPNGGALIGRTGVRKEKAFDVINLSERSLMRNYGMDAFICKYLEHWITIGERARNATATLENMGRSMDEAGVTHSACMPIAPYVTFDDLSRAREKDARILPFTSVDFSSDVNISEKLEEDVRRGAMGLKLHPVIQAIPLNDRRVMETLQAFEKFGKPVLTHAGISNYYLGAEKSRNVPEYGKIGPIEDMVKAFPGIKFIIGHSGLFQSAEAMKRLKGCANVWVDTSFQSPGKIRKLVAAFGEDRVMYASDWPYGNRLPSIRTVWTACRGNKKLEERILWENARDLLGMKL